MANRSPATREPAHESETNVMDRDHLLALYDRDYAASYDRKFLTSELAKPDVAHELRLLGGLLKPGVSWLDVACGTGFFLAKFPDRERAGLDLSPAMLEIAGRANPGVTFVNQSYLDAVPGWEGRWDLVSCMWYSYGFVDSMDELGVLVANLARWTSASGRCFVPLADPRFILGADLPYEMPSVWGGSMKVSAILWSYIEEGGRKVHRHQLAPQVEVMTELFGRHFESVEIETYPPAFPGWQGRRSALIAGKKRPPGPAKP
jgi:SAM-dependent methyltransferase